MPSLPAYRPSNGATITINAGLWTATGRTDRTVTIVVDARLFMDFVNVAANNTNLTMVFGLGNPPATVTLV